MSRAGGWFAARTAWSAALAAAVLLMPAPAPAQPSGANGPDWAFGHPAGEAVVGGVSALSLLTALLPQLASDWEPSSHRPHDPVPDVASNFTGSVIGTSWQLVGAYGLEVGYYREHQVADPFDRAWRSSLIDIEALLLSLGGTYALKRLTGRCRPRAWHPRDDASGTCDLAERDAFVSGHTSMVGSVAGTRLFMAARSSGAAAPRYASFAFAESATVVTAVLRVLAGAHSWEDVVGGVVVSHGAAALVSFAHPMDALPRDPRRAGDALPRQPAWVGWSGQF